MFYIWFGTIEVYGAACVLHVCCIPFVVAGKTNQLSFPFLGNETRKNKLSKFIQFNIPAVGASAR